MIKDLINWFFLKKTIKKNKDSIEWNKFNLRIDWIYRIYTVIHLKEILDSDEFTKWEHIANVLEKSKPINEYLSLLNLAEILEPKITKIKDSDSYLIVYNFIWNFWNWKKILLFILLIIGSFMMTKNIDIISIGFQDIWKNITSK